MSASTAGSLRATCWRKAAPRGRSSTACLSGTTLLLRKKFRLEQAREVIGNIAVVRMIEGRPTEPVRAFVNIVPADRERGYSSIVKVLSNREYAHQLLETALAEFQALRNKYAILVELAELFDD